MTGTSSISFKILTLSLCFDQIVSERLALFYQSVTNNFVPLFVTFHTSLHTYFCSAQNRLLSVRETPHFCTLHILRMYEEHLISIRDIPYRCTWHTSLRYMTCLLLHVTHLTSLCNRPLLCTLNTSLLHGTCLTTSTHDTSHFYAWHAWPLYETLFISLRDIPYFYMWQIPLLYVICLFAYVTYLTSLRDPLHFHTWMLTSIRGTWHSSILYVTSLCSELGTLHLFEWHTLHLDVTTLLLYMLFIYTWHTSLRYVKGLNSVRHLPTSIRTRPYFYTRPNHFYT